MSGNDTIVPLRPVVADEPVAPTLDAIVGQMEMMASNIAILIELATRMDTRVRALELSVRKTERRNVPVIVNQLGQPVKSGSPSA